MNNYGSENSSDVIAPQNCSSYNLTRASEGHSTVLTIFAILELTIFMLKLLLGCVVIYCLYRSKMLRDPVSALMTSVTASLMTLSIPLNLLVGLSVLIDQPPIGSCNIRFLLVTVFFIINIQIYLIPFSIGLIATVQFLIIKYGLKRVSTRNVLSAFALLMPFVVGVSIVQSAAALWKATVTHITGLLFAAYTSAQLPVLIVPIFGHGVPIVITLVTSYMTYRTVKSGIVEIDNDNRVTKSVLIMNVTTITTDLFIKTVTSPSYVYWAISQDTISSVMLTLFFGVEPFYVLILFIAIHKTIRRTIVGAISDCIKSPNSVWPEPVSRQTECKL
eukprot:Em0001g2304a